MLKIVHLLTGVAALLLSFAPSLRGQAPFLEHNAALGLFMVGLLNIQFIPFYRLQVQGVRPVLAAASALMIIAAIVQAIVVLAPIGQIAGQPATLATLLLAVVAVLLHLASLQTQAGSRPQATSHRRSGAPSAGETAGTEGPRETGTVKWFN
ncbi:MAG TPA: cold-shock protein, partial [Pseudomonas sp.]|nr:cold-shock protein [Pseudomonas sp.]